MKLRPYQQLIIDHILDKERCNAFVPMGLGKTISTLKALESLSLLMSPRRLFWRRYALRRAPGLTKLRSGISICLSRQLLVRQNNGPRHFVKIQLSSQSIMRIYRGS